MLEQVYMFFWDLFFEGLTNSFLISVAPILCSLISLAFLSLVVFTAVWVVYRVIRFILSLAGGV